MSAFDWPQAERDYRALLERPLASCADLERLLYERGALDAHIEESGARIHDHSATHTNDEEAKRVYRWFWEEIYPQYGELRSQVDRRVVESPFASELEVGEFGVMLRDLRAAVELYREENLALEARDDVLGTQYSEWIGAMDVELGGETMTMAAARAKLEAPDRDLREAAWRASTARRLADAERFDQLYDEQVRLRDRMGRNAGLDGYTPYTFRKKRRFDYGPADCAAFHAGVEEHFVPLQAELLERRRVRLGLDVLRPWDLQVDPGGQAALAPFADAEELVEKTSRAFHALDPELGALFERLRDGASLDLETRMGKAPGGYQNSYYESKGCFILMNAVGTQRDVETLLHEGGHAFHTLLGCEQELYANRDTTPEFSEVASMAMELLTHPYLGAFYSQTDADRARRVHLERIVELFPWIAMGDAFQHWVYAHPSATPDERAEAWTELDRRFRPALDWTGLERERGREWQRVPHFFSHPYYYIEYGIAQLGALGIWQRSLQDEADAMRHYKDALRLGGSRRLPELFEAAGVPFDLGPDALGRAAALLRGVL